MSVFASLQRQRLLDEALTRPSIGSRVLDTILGPIKVAGNILDTPGSIIRGLLSDDPSRTFTGIFDLEDRVSGAELLGHPRDKFTWGGLGVELALDPLNAITLGTLSATGKAAKTIGKFGNKLDALEAFASTYKNTPDALTNRIANIAGKRQSLINEFGNAPLKETLGQQARAGQRNLINFDIPFTGVNIPLVRGAPVFDALGSVSRGTQAIPGVTRTLDALGQKFNPNFKLSPLEREVRNEFRVLSRGAEAEGRRIQKYFSRKYEDLSKELGISLPNLEREVALAVESGGDTPKDLATFFENSTRFDPKVLRLAQEVRDYQEELLQQGIDEGIPGLTRFQGETEYLQRVLTPQAKQLIFSTKDPSKTIDRIVRKLPEGVPGFTQERKLFRDKDIAEANKLLKKQYKVDFDFFSLDIPTNLAFRTEQQLKSIAEGKTVETFVKVFGEEKFKGAVDGAKAFTALNRKNRRFSQNIRTVFRPYDALPRFVRKNIDKPDYAAAELDLQESFKRGVIQRHENRKLLKQISKDNTILDQIANIAWQTDGDVTSILNHLAAAFPENIAAEEAGQIIKVASDVANRFKNLKPELTVVRNLAKQVITEPPAEIQNDVVRWLSSSKQTDIAQALDSVGLTKRYLGKQEYENLKQILTVPQDPQFIKKFTKTLDSVNAVYRGLLTQLFPSYHIRNAATGVFMNTLSGLRPDEVVKFTKQAQRAYFKLTDEEQTYLKSLGVLGRGLHEETWRIIRDSHFGKSKKLGKVFQNQIFGTARNVGFIVDDINRYSMYLANKAKGMLDDEAAEQVLKYHFDYEDLTGFEKKVARRTVLFYTFIRKNIPLMLRSLVENPRFMQLYNRTVGNTNANLEQPPWAFDGFYLGEDDEGNTRRWSLGLPPEDLTRFGTNGQGYQRFFQLFFSQFNPFVTGGIQIISGQNLFFGKKEEGSLIERVAKYSPFSRFVGTLERATENPVQELLRTGAGFNVKTFNPEELKRQNQKFEIRRKLEELAQQGDANRFTVYSGEDERVKTLNSALNRLIQSGNN